MPLLKVLRDENVLAVVVPKAVARLIGSLGFAA